MNVSLRPSAATRVSRASPPAAAWLSPPTTASRPRSEPSRPISYSPGRRTAPVSMTEPLRGGTWIRIPSCTNGFCATSPRSSKASRSSARAPAAVTTCTYRTLPRGVIPPASRITSCTRRVAVTNTVPGCSTSPDTVSSKARAASTATVTSANRKIARARSATRRCASSTVRPATGTAPMGGTLIVPSRSTTGCCWMVSTRPTICTSRMSPGPSR